MTMPSIAIRCKHQAMQSAIFMLTIVFLRSVGGAAQSPPLGQVAEVQASETSEIRRILAEQQQQIDDQRREIDESKQRLNETRTIAETTSDKVAAFEQQAPAAARIEQRLEQVELAEQRDPGLPSAVVASGDSPGFNQEFPALILRSSSEARRG